jgi:hypothetical protein
LALDVGVSQAGVYGQQTPAAIPEDSSPEEGAEPLKTSWQPFHQGHFAQFLRNLLEKRGLFHYKIC